MLATFEGRIVERLDESHIVALHLAYGCRKLAQLRGEICGSLSALDMQSTQGKPSRESGWLYRWGRIGTNCPRYVGALRDLQATACSDMSVLLLGPTGTGKELLARAIHRASGRAGEFIAINCASLPEHLVCSELFGFERGAFSGAERAQPGALRASNGGTLFLDEVADAPLPVQVALLRALELQRVRPLGGVRELPVRLRVVAATYEGEVVAPQVSRAEVGIILSLNPERAGGGRVFFALEDDLALKVESEFSSAGMETRRAYWGMPVIVVRDLDGNDLIFTDESVSAGKRAPTSA